MKKMLSGIACLAALVCFASCGSTQVAEKTVAAKDTKHVNRELIDWKGASFGAEVPSWVFDANEQDYTALSKLPQFSKKRILFAEGQGQNLDLLKSWANNFDVQAQFSRSVSNFVSANFGGELSGSKDNGVSENFLDEIVATFSKTEINGLSKELDFWTLTRMIDNDKGSSKDVYSYIVVYAIDQNDFNYQLSKALGLVETKNEAEAELKSRVETAMTENKVWAERKLDR